MQQLKQMVLVWVILIGLSVSGCIQKTTCWKIINGGKCIPIKSYEEWNRCVMPCENVIINSKTKPYNSENNKWMRPRPYACLLYTSDAADE